ncbi:hypothetical protein [Methylobacterium sp. WL116]|uniref:hypothetical protein n=1 Tax=Methylobacterium sp. WL116 TaxID=2603889 RepID=UPI0011CB5BD8|nr:hypothetical protein [Methylobacterium sp. WL116]TXM94944.1 hypothetical protein FV223_02720 [Methylobacterium sp. WL116]
MLYLANRRSILTRQGVIIACFICSMCIVSDLKADDNVFVVYDIASTTGIELGRGYDTLTGTPRSNCVDIQKRNEPSGIGPDSVTFHAYRVENSSQLDKSLGISASASIKIGIGSGSASSSYTKEMSVSSYSLSYVVESAVRQKGPSIDVQDLQNRYKVLLNSKKEDAYRRFRMICGDGFISEMPTGGDFRAVVQIATNSQKANESTAASLGGSYGTTAAAGSFANAVKKAAQSSEVRLWSFRRGGDGPVPITADDIASSAANLPTLARQSPAPVQIAVMNYIGVLDDPTLPLPTFIERSSSIAGLARMSSKARDQISDVRYILDNPEQFYGQTSDIFQLNNELNALVSFREVVSARADQCMLLDGGCVIGDLSVPSPLARPARR